MSRCWLRVTSCAEESPKRNWLGRLRDRTSIESPDSTMPAVKGESADESPVLFMNTKGEPMRFFIRPGPTKVELQPLITKGGGILSRTQEPRAFLLADPGEISAVVDGAGQFYISTQYIHDCVLQNQHLDIENYRFSNAQAVCTKTFTRKQKSVGRVAYSLEDDTAILDFITKRLHEAKGNRVWQQMEQQGVTSHSWQSMKNRFLKRLQYQLTDKSPVKRKRGAPLKDRSVHGISPKSPRKKRGTPLKDRSVHGISPKSPRKKRGTPLKDRSVHGISPKSPRKKKTVTKALVSSDSDSTQISPDVQGLEKRTPTDQPHPLSSPEKSRSRQHADSEKNLPHTLGDEVEKEPLNDMPDQGLSPEEEQQRSQQDNKELEASCKKARVDEDVTGKDTLDGPNEQTTPTKTRRNSPRKCGRKLGILERAAREFEDSQVEPVDGESQEDRPPSRVSSVSEETDECQIMAARERAVADQEGNAEHRDTEQQTPQVQSNNSITEGPVDERPGSSKTAELVTSNAHMFIFDQSQEDPSQPSQTEPLAQDILETKQQVVNLMQESKKDLLEVMKALLKASGDVTIARIYLLEGYDSELHGPLWTRHDDKVLLLADSSLREQLNLKYGTDGVSRRLSFLQAH